MSRICLGCDSDRQVYCILLMFLAAAIFGGIIGELQVLYAESGADNLKILAI